MRPNSISLLVVVILRNDPKGSEAGRRAVAINTGFESGRTQAECGCDGGTLELTLIGQGGGELKAVVDRTEREGGGRELGTGGKGLAKGREEGKDVGCPHGWAAGGRREG